MANVAAEFSTLAFDNDGPTASPVTMPSSIGEYELLEELGRGGMGVVYRAHQSSLDRDVAIKMVLRGDWASPVDLARFRAEAESAARLEHPNIVPIYEVGEHEGLPYFCMRLIDGVTFSQKLANGPMDSREAAELMLPVCRAIAAAHHEGILHRDLKPSNILIDHDNVPYITDFGLAKRIPTEANPASPDTLTGSGAILGTPSYMAPEQAASQRERVEERTDIYSLGAILYALICGEAPFQAATPVDTIMQVLEQDPVPPRLVNPQADADLEMITLKCLQKPIDLRYKGADALAEDLQAFLNNEPVSARSSQFSQVLSRAFRETHHAVVLENWGLLWMWHSLVLVILCLLTNWLQARGSNTPWPFLWVWGAGAGLWALIFWNLRKKAGPVTFVERQIAHVWAGSMAGSILLFLVEPILGFQPLQLSPVLGLLCGAVFLVKAGILSGRFYVQAAVLFASAPLMAWIQQRAIAASSFDYSISLFGLLSGASFFFPGLKYHRQLRRGRSRTGVS
ncbi:MAG TPA: serine/threonine protein kinase, partial [Planctomycetaceae bacterium]|nr:serine/threonine protein kinase [Planctomycetaceae bacterium]